MRELLPLVCLLGITACGARSGLLSTSEVTDASASGGSGGSSSGGTGGTVSVDAGVDAANPEACVLHSVGAPKEMLAFAEGNTDSPLMAVIDPGGTKTARIGFAAVSEDANGWHPELRVAEVSVGPIWPTDTEITREPVLYGFDAHAWGAMVEASGQNGNLALAFYHADEASPNVQPAYKFRSFDTTSWSPGPEVAIDDAGSVSYGFTRSPNGYATTWRATALGSSNTEPRLAILDVNGNVTQGPIAVGPPEPYPGRSSDVVWSGTRYLIATSFAGCDISPAPCEKRAVVITTPLADGTLQLTTAIPALTDGDVPRRALVSAFAGSVWVAWTEAPPPPEEGSDTAPRKVRLAHLDEDGALLGEPLLLTSDAHPYLSPTIAATAHGIVVAYPEIANPDLPESFVGHGRMRVHNVGHDGNVLQQPLDIETTLFANGPHPSLVALASPRSVLVAWAARSPEKQLFVTFLARLDCELE